MKIRAYNKTYNAYRGKSQWKKWLLIVLAAIVALVLLLTLAGWLLFRHELSITSTIKKLDTPTPAYFMEVKGDYYFDEFLASGGASSDGMVSSFLSKKISKGFYEAPVGSYREGCSVLSAWGPDGHLWGRNYDWSGTVPIIVRHIPEDGYASLSTCDFSHITMSSKTYPDGMVNKMLAIAALYVPLDGVNEMGLCVADLEVNEGGMPDPDTDKPDLTVTTAIRLLLNKASTVDQALELLKQYDIHPSGGISHHIAISDSGGKSVSVEFTEDGFTAVNTDVVTNFNLANGNTAAGGEGAEQRYNSLMDFFLGSQSATAERVKNAMSHVAQTSGTQATQWSMVFNQSEPFVTWYFMGEFERGITFKFLPETD